FDRVERYRSFRPGWHRCIPEGEAGPSGSHCGLLVDVLSVSVEPVNGPDQIENTENGGVMNAKASRVAVVTGGSGGIGGSVARRLADDGMAVAVQYAESESR